MNRTFWIFTYRMIIFPAIFLAAHVTALFSKKVRSVLRSKYAVYRDLVQWLAKNNYPRKNVMFHAASLGEFEHIRPVLFQLKKRFTTNNMITFFSPSGFQNVTTGVGVDYFCYTPFDTVGQWQKIYRAVKPVMIVIAKHDVWPAQIWAARNEDIPVFLINASLSAKSTRARFPFGRILSVVYRDFREIMTISEEDSQRFRSSFTGLHISVAGDTKYDQVLLRMEKAQQAPPVDLNWRRNSRILVAGSIWSEDEEHLVPALQNLLDEFKMFKIILVPHEPSKSAVARLRKKFKTFAPDLFSELAGRQPDSRVLVVDQIGHLAGLYVIADMAYVGGSFKQGIHNTMEPAVYGIPVIYGPEYRNSYEAVKLLETGGATMVSNQKEIRTVLTGLIADASASAEIGEKAKRYALENTGATEKLIASWADILKETAI